MKFILGFISGVFCSMILFWILESKPANTANTAKEVSEVTETADHASFDDFYERFHADSLYQLEHIVFPLEGLPADVDSLTLVERSFRWQKADWRMHKAFDDMDGSFIREMIPFGEDIMMEQIKHQSGRYGMQRRFVRFDDGWMLIYYSAMNELQVEE